MNPKDTNVKKTQYIFHISRSGSRPAFFHTLNADQQLIPQLLENDILGRYGKEPRIETVALFRNDLYRKIETAVKFWLFELRFIPRFLVSSGIFLVVYFIASFAVRDPLPMIDEILIAGAVSVAAYILMGRRFLGSQMAAEKRNDLRTVVDGIAFTESDFVKKAEELLEVCDTADPDKLLQMYNSPDVFILLPEWKTEAEMLECCLRIIFSEKRLRDFGKRLERQTGLEEDHPAENLKRLLSATRIDFSLYVLYTALNRSFK